MNRIFRSPRTRPFPRVATCCCLAGLLLAAGQDAGRGLALMQAAAAIDLDEPGLHRDAAAAPLPPPKDDFKPVSAKPDFLSDQEWAGVQALARSSADPAHETARLVDYLQFQKTYFQWSSARATKPQMARQLAQQLIDGLPEKVAQGAVGAEQADQTLVQLVAFLEINPDRQKERLEVERRRLPPQPAVPPAFSH